MKGLIGRYLASGIRAALYSLETYLVLHGAVSEDHRGVLTNSQLVDVLVGIVAWGITLLWSLIQKHAQEQLFQTAHKADPQTPKEDITTLVKKGFGVKVPWLGVLVLLLLPLTANAQTLNDSARVVIHDYVLSHPMQAAEQPATSTIIPGVEDNRVLQLAQAVYVMGMGADTWAACNAVRQKDVKGATINTPSNSLVPDECGKIIAEKAGVGLAALVASSRLWSDHKFYAIATLAGTGAAFFASAMKTAYDPKDVGTFPAVPAKAVRLNLKVSF